jgi:hypothetical protein
MKKKNLEVTPFICLALMVTGVGLGVLLGMYFIFLELDSDLVFTIALVVTAAGLLSLAVMKKK